MVATAAIYHDMGSLLKHDPLWECKGGSTAKQAMEAAGTNGDDEAGEQEIWAAAIEADVQTRQWRWSDLQRPAMMIVTMVICLVWVLWGCAWTTVDSGSYVCGVTTALAKNRQHTFRLPTNHPLQASEEELQRKTQQFCSCERGAAMYSKWEKDVGSTFKFGDISKDERKKYLQVLFNFQELFDRDPKSPKAIKGVECALDFKVQNPRARARPVPRLSPAEWKYMEQETNTMFKNGIIELSQSDWAAVPVFAKKKDGGLRFACDLRQINDCLHFDRYGMPHIEEVLDSLSSASVFSTYDILSGFWGLSVK